jgi:tetratricopeptide (TPR) repeat protein
MSKFFYDPSGLITRIFAYLIKGQVDQAKQQVNNQLLSENESSQRDSADPLLYIALAIIEYIDFNYKQALTHLKKVVDINPLSPSDIWMAIGICYFKLNNIPKAKFALDYVLEIDPQNAMAMTALGVTELLISTSDNS